MSQSMPDYDAAHEHSTHHRQEVNQSEQCGCFYCLNIFPAEETVWGVYSEETGACPECGIDSVIPDAAGYPITDVFLKGMKRRWFCAV